MESTILTHQKQTRNEPISVLKRTILVCLFSLLAGVLPFYQSIFNWNNILIYRDLGILYVPGKYFWLEGVLRDGFIPRWNTLAHSGTPFFAEASNGVLNFLNLIFLFFPKEHFYSAFSFFIAAHLSLIYAGGFLLLRVLRIPFKLALWAAIPFAWCGYAISATNLIHILSGVVSINFFLAFWLLYIRHKLFIHLMFASFFLSFPIFGGDPQFTYILSIIAFVLFLLKTKSFPNTLAALSKLALLSLLCSAAQLFPTLELVFASERVAGGMDFQSTLLFSLHPQQLLEFIFPLFFGNISPQDTYWGASLNHPHNLPLIFSCYLGTMFLFSTLLGIALQKKNYLLKSKNTSLLIAAFFALVVSLGSHARVYAVLAKLLPMWSSFRHPSRLAIWLVVCLLIFQAKSLRRFFLWLKIRKRRKYNIFLLFPGLALIGFSMNFFSLSEPAKESINYVFSFLLIYSGLLILTIRSMVRERMLFAALALLSAADLWNISTKFTWEQPRWITSLETYPNTKKIVEDLEKRREEIKRGASFRLFTPNAYKGNWDPEKIKDSMDIPGYLALQSWENLAANIPALYGISSITGYTSITPAQKITFWRLLNESHPKRLLDLLGARYVMEREFGIPPAVKPNLDAVPYLFFPEKIHKVSDQSEAHKILLAEDFSPMKEVVLQNSTNNEIQNIQGRKPSLTIEKSDGASMTIKISTNTEAPPQLLAWNETFDPHWMAMINDIRAPVKRLNLWAMGIELPKLPPGEHVLRFLYKSEPIFFGQILSFLWLLLFLVSFFSVSGWRQGTRFRLPKIACFDKNCH